MPNINATKYVNGSGTMTQNFSTARESDSSTHTDNSTSSNIGAIQFFRDSGKGATNYKFHRLFCTFDFSSYTSGTMTNLVFNYRATTSTGNAGALERRVAIVKFDGMGSGPSFSNYQDSEFFDDIDYSTPYTVVSGFSIPEWTDANSDATIAMNSTAISDAQSNGELKIAIVQYQNDYNGSDASSDVHYDYHANFSTGASGFVPFVSFDFAASYGNAVIGVSSGNIANVKGVATANIANVIGVS